jgi:hypothetical protein
MKMRYSLADDKLPNMVLIIEIFWDGYAMLKITHLAAKSQKCAAGGGHK